MILSKGGGGVDLQKKLKFCRPFFGQTKGLSDFFLITLTTLFRPNFMPGKFLKNRPKMRFKQFLVNFDQISFFLARAHPAKLVRIEKPAHP